MRTTSSRPHAAIGLPKSLRCCVMEAGTAGVTRPITVIIADDHTVVRDGVRAVLQREAGEFEVVGEAADIPSLIREVREHKPDLLTLDLRSEEHTSELQSLRHL